MTVSIRIATLQDAKSIASIGRTAFTAAYGPHNTREDTQRHIEQTYTTELVEKEMRAGCIYCFATADSQPAGFGKLRKQKHPDSVPGIHPVEIHQLYFLPKFQRRGIGTQLFQELKNQAQMLGGDGLFLGVWQKATWAIGFYEKCGMQPVGVLTFRVGNDDQSDHLMYLPISKSSRSNDQSE